MSQNPNSIFGSYMQSKPLMDAFYGSGYPNTQNNYAQFLHSYAGAVNPVYRDTETIAPYPSVHRCGFCGGMVGVSLISCPNCGGPL